MTFDQSDNFYQQTIRFQCDVPTREFNQEQEEFFKSETIFAGGFLWFVLFSNVDVKFLPITIGTNTNVINQM